jgi:RNA polymerase sigma factor (sigma-70 family)
MPKDLRIELRARNNVLWHVIFDTAASVAEFCRVHGLDQGAVGGLLNLTESPYGVTPGRWETPDGRTILDINGYIRTQHTLRVRPLATQLCALAGLDVETLFPPQLYASVVSTKTAVELDSVTFLPLLAARGHAALTGDPEDVVAIQERQDMIQAVLSTLTERERTIITQRYGLDGEGERTLREVGQQLQTSVEYTRQLEHRALRKLRGPARRRLLQTVT